MTTAVDIALKVSIKPVNKLTDELLLKVGDGITLKVPAHDAIRALVGPALNGNGVELPTPASTTAAPAIALPKIGAEWKGGIYVGLTLARESAVGLVLLPGDEKLNWEDAMKWAEKQGGVLPSRIDALVLFQNVKDQFKGEYYWTAEPYAPDAGYAWLQGFNYGNQDTNHKGTDYRARAVRRIAIQ